MVVNHDFVPNFVAQSPYWPPQASRIIPYPYLELDIPFYLFIFSFNKLINQTLKSYSDHNLNVESFLQV
jgi:hypothetical protein